MTLTSAAWPCYIAQVAAPGMLEMIMQLLKSLSKKRRRTKRPPSLIQNVARFVACEMIEGDYIEFGVYQGNSFIASFQALNEAFKSRIADAGGDNSTPAQANERSAILKRMRFFAFDSFEGLPELSGVDKDTKDFQPGQYRFEESQFLNRIERKGVDLDRVVTVPGWFDKTCCPETREQHRITAASVIWVDGDLYESAVPALEFVTPLLQDGTVVIFDDWFAFRGNPRRGEQRAFYEWIDRLDGFTATEYQREGVWRNSFIMNRK